MALTSTDRAFLRGQFPGLRTLTDAQVNRWFFHHHLNGNPAYTIDDESNDL
ncbi:MAG TPA: hypothetical protein PLF37_15725 [Planctomycetota bacterium]|nr:hypothetical protein [Planctomycetota bacterium]